MRILCLMWHGMNQNVVKYFNCMFLNLQLGGELL